MGLTKQDREFLRGLAGPQKWKELEARRALSLLEWSGSSRAAFSREFGLTTTRLAWWKRRLTRGEATRSCVATRGQDREGEAFVELVGSTSGAVPAARLRVGAVEVELCRLDSTAAAFVVELARRAEEDLCS